MIDGYWLAIKDGDHRGLALYERHYSSKKSRGRLTVARVGNMARFVGTGEKLILLSHGCDALFAWRRERYRQDGQVGIECAIFRKEGPGVASEMIQEAVSYAWRKWPDQRLFTFVDPTEIRSSNPGYCFKKAGFTFCGVTSKGLHILERLPPEQPDASEIVEMAQVLVDAIDGEDPDWLTAIEWLREAVHAYRNAA